VALLDEVGAYVSTNVSALTIGTNLFLSMMPDEPAICAALYSVTSDVPYFTMNGANNQPVLENPRIQLYVRHSSYATGEALAYTIWQQMTEVADEALSGVDYLRLQAMGSPEFLERDENFNVLWSANFQAMKALS
tara:strand:- start:259 stop:663 length:405 start_codon:yes stop_codon:yes gene_type:complete